MNEKAINRQAINRQAINRKSINKHTLKWPGLNSVRLALLAGLITLSGSVYSAGATTPDQAPGEAQATALEPQQQAIKAAEDAHQPTVDETAAAPDREDATVVTEQRDRQDADATTASSDESESTPDDSASTHGGPTDNLPTEPAITDAAAVSGDSGAVVNQADNGEPEAEKQDRPTQTDDFVLDKVNVNTATAEELVETLKGIGPKKAQAIIDYRTKHGPFTTLEQLKEVKGIGPATLARNQDRVEL